MAKKDKSKGETPTTKSSKGLKVAATERPLKQVKEMRHLLHPSTVRLTMEELGWQELEERPAERPRKQVKEQQELKREGVEARRRKGKGPR